MRIARESSRANDEIETRSRRHSLDPGGRLEARGNRRLFDLDRTAVPLAEIDESMSDVDIHYIVHETHLVTSYIAGLYTPAACTMMSK